VTWIYIGNYNASNFNDSKHVDWESQGTVMVQRAVAVVHEDRVSQVVTIIKKSSRVYVVTALFMLF
jgi:cellobiose phosphorylase